MNDQWNNGLERDPDKLYDAIPYATILSHDDPEPAQAKLITDPHIIDSVMESRSGHHPESAPHDQAEPLWTNVFHPPLAPVLIASLTVFIFLFW